MLITRRCYGVLALCFGAAIGAATTGSVLAELLKSIDGNEVGWMFIIKGRGYPGLNCLILYRRDLFQC